MTPDNASYYHAAYAVAIAVYGLYIVSLLKRTRTVASRESRVAREVVASRETGSRGS